MNPDKMRSVLQLGEGTTLEFKTSLRAKESIGKTICGFLNGTGGYILCGIGDGGKVVGANESESQIRKFQQFIREAINPSALVSAQAETLGNKEIIVIEVPKGSDPPYSFKNVHYLRHAESAQIMDQATIRDIVLRSEIEPQRWERRFSTADPGDDLDRQEIRNAVRDTEKVKRVTFSEPSNPVRVLQDLDVAKYGRLTNAGDILFTSRPSSRHPQTRVRAMRYSSDKAGAKFSDMKSFEGPLHDVFEEAYTFIVRNTTSVSLFRAGQPKREDMPLYPEDAVREGLINALVHREYSSPSGGVSIHIYPKRLEIWNSGRFPEGITSESLRNGQISVLRNPDIAHVLYLRGLMEKAGRGSVLIINLCIEQNLPQPKWTSDEALGVTLTFFAPQDAPQDAPQVTPQVDRLLRVIRGTMKREEIQIALELKDRKNFTKNYLNPAIDVGLIEMTEKLNSPNQRYRLTKNGEKVLKQKR